MSLPEKCVCVTFSSPHHPRCECDCHTDHSSLPAWVEKLCPANIPGIYEYKHEDIRKVFQALSIAWAFIKEEQLGAHHVAADEVARRIEEVGK